MLLVEVFTFSSLLYNVLRIYGFKMSDIIDTGLSPPGELQHIDVRGINRKN